MKFLNTQTPPDHRTFSHIPHLTPCTGRCKKQADFPPFFPPLAEPFPAHEDRGVPRRGVRPPAGHCPQVRGAPAPEKLPNLPKLPAQPGGGGGAEAAEHQLLLPDRRGVGVTSPGHRHRPRCHQLGQVRGRAGMG